MNENVATVRGLSDAGLAECLEQLSGHMAKCGMSLSQAQVEEAARRLRRGGAAGGGRDGKPA